MDLTAFFLSKPVTSFIMLCYVMLLFVFPIIDGSANIVASLSQINCAILLPHKLCAHNSDFSANNLFSP